MARKTTTSPHNISSNIFHAPMTARIEGGGHGGEPYLPRGPGGGGGALNQGQAPASSGAVPLEHEVDDKQVHEHVSEGVMRLSSGSGGSGGGGSRSSSSGSSGGSGSRSDSGSSSGGGGSRSGGSGSKGGGSRSGGGSRGGGSRSGSGSKGRGSRGGGSRGTTNYDDDDDSVLDVLDYDDSSAGARGGAWKTGVAATFLAVASLLYI
ncbi:hypothetical protein BDA96_10G326300 [Sorghum bicolor]|uniref:Uncharacterized protein n=1 Tax=Sorghum bicolor TaxID=4558 RepID=A0A921Q5I7_SORBI|nr:hypothetical protein BDA96_10G326300 [Sorghum bicolor]